MKQDKKSSLPNDKAAHSSAIVKDNYDQLPREAKRTNDSTFDRIWKYYHNNKTRVELTEEEQRTRERWEKAWLLLARHRVQKEVVELIEKLYSVSRSVAYDDVRNAMQIFSNPQLDIKDAKRVIAETMIMKGLNRSFKNGDMEAYGKFLKLYIEVNGLTVQEDDKMKDALRNLKATMLIFVTSPDQLRKDAEKLMEGIPAVDTKFTDVTNEEQATED